MSTPKWIHSHKPFLLVEHYQPLDLGWNWVTLPSIHKIQLSAVWFSDSNSSVGEKCNCWVHCRETLTPENRGASSRLLIKLQTYFPSASEWIEEFTLLGEHGEIKHLNNHYRQHQGVWWEGGGGREKNRKRKKETCVRCLVVKHKFLKHPWVATGAREPKSRGLERFAAFLSSK